MRIVLDGEPAAAVADTGGSVHRGERQPHDGAAQSAGSHGAPRSCPEPRRADGKGRRAGAATWLVGRGSPRGECVASLCTWPAEYIYLYLSAVSFIHRIAEIHGRWINGASLVRTHALLARTILRARARRAAARAHCPFAPSHRHVRLGRVRCI